MNASQEHFGATFYTDTRPRSADPASLPPCGTVALFFAARVRTPFMLIFHFHAEPT